MEENDMEQGKYETGPQTSAADAAYNESREKSRKVWNSMRPEKRPPTDSLYFGKV
jgi:hypothetical protein